MPQEAQKSVRPSATLLTQTKTCSNSIAFFALQTEQENRNPQAA
jgi:hypothetical protein